MKPTENARLPGRARLGLRGKLVLLLTVIGGLLFAVAAGTILTLDQARLAASSRVVRELQEMMNLDEIDALATELQATALTQVFASDIDEFASLETRMAAADGRVRTIFSRGWSARDERGMRALDDAYEAMAEVRDRQLIPVSRLNSHEDTYARAGPGGAYESASDRFARALEAMHVEVGNEQMEALESGDLVFARVRALMLAGPLVVDGLAVALAALLANRTAQRVLCVAAAAEQVSAGEMDVRLGMRDVEASDEVGKAAGAFNQMAEREVVPGPGLGLALVRRIAELHGGSITAANTPDGVHLTLRLPPAPQCTDKDGLTRPGAPLPSSSPAELGAIFPERRYTLTQ